MTGTPFTARITWPGSTPRCGAASGLRYVSSQGRPGRMRTISKPRPSKTHVGAEHADRHRLDVVVALAAPHVGVARPQLADHLADEIVELGAGADARQQRLVLREHRRPINAPQVRGPVEVALEAPGLLQDVRPLRSHV